MEAKKNQQMIVLTEEGMLSHQSTSKRVGARGSLPSKFVAPASYVNRSIDFGTLNPDVNKTIQIPKNTSASVAMKYKSGKKGAGRHSIETIP